VNDTLSRSALAKLTGVSPDTIRHYERKGVLPAPPRTANGYRRYPADAVQRVRLVQRALTIGFTLDELQRVLRQREKGGAPCREVRAIVAARFAELQERVKDLTALRDELAQVLDDWDDRLKATPAGRQARLLDALSGNMQLVSLGRARRSRLR
jgi:MerR family transcriptional regulator, copper efflux regulator